MVSRVTDISSPRHKRAERMGPGRRRDAIRPTTMYVLAIADGILACSD